MSPMGTERKQRDGRTVRAERTRHALVEALLALLNEGRLRPTAAEIADRAGVSERSVFQHFPDREALLEAVAREQYERVMPTIRPVDASLSLAARIDEFVAQRATLYERASGVGAAVPLLRPHPHPSPTSWPVG
jgi:TetR/AcrR family transcriptional regulator, regulator of autoinduction and epiphytic fitness